MSESEILHDYLSMTASTINTLNVKSCRDALKCLIKNWPKDASINHCETCSGSEFINLISPSYNEEKYLQENVQNIYNEMNKMVSSIKFLSSN